MKKGFLITGIVLTVLGLLIFLGALFASGFDLSRLSTATYETNQHPVSETFQSVEIRTDEAEIRFVASEDGTTRVDCVERAKVRHEVAVENGILKITADDKRTWIDHLNLFAFKPLSVTVHLPAARYDALTVATGTGKVTVPDPFTFGKADIMASTGDVSFDASVEGGLTIRTSTGDIRVTGVRSSSAEFSVSTGKVELKNLNCAETLSVKVSTGKAVLTDVSCKELISTGSTGSITLKNTVASESLNIQRDTGDVELENCDAGQITVKTSTGDVTGTLRSAKVFITKSSTGKIDVPDSVSGGRCELSTSTGDIRIRFENGFD